MYKIKFTISVLSLVCPELIPLTHSMETESAWKLVLKASMLWINGAGDVSPGSLPNLSRVKAS